MENKDVIKTIEANKKHFNEKTTFATINFIIAVVCFVCSLALFSFARSYSIPPQIIQLQDNGSLFTKTPLNLPTKTTKELKQWYVDTLSETFTYTHRNMSEHTNTLSRKYDPEALSSIDNFINSSNFAVRVRNNFGIVEVVISDEITLQSGMMGEVMGWQLETRAALMIYMQGNVLRAGVYDVSALVVRTSEEVNPDGLEINRITLKEVK
ncbi:conserved hypothetical protein [Vibrio chagasii]|nr:conserved hypothetical protein [Vibrio chagasii]